MGSGKEIDSSSNVIPVKLFLGMVPSSSADITRVLSECFREGSIYIICMLFRFKAKENLQRCGDDFFEILIASKGASAIGIMF